jgi:DNA-binding phage protein
MPLIIVDKNSSSIKVDEVVVFSYINKDKVLDYSYDLTRNSNIIFNANANVTKLEMDLSKFEGNYDSFLYSTYKIALEEIAKLNVESVVIPLVTTKIYQLSNNDIYFKVNDMLSSSLYNKHGEDLFIDKEIYLYIIDPFSNLNEDRFLKNLNKNILKIRYDSFDDNRHTMNAAPIRIKSVKIPKMCSNEISQSNETVKKSPNTMDAAPIKIESVERSYEKSQPSETVEESLNTILKKKGKNFVETLFSIIDSKKLKDSEVYKKANIDRRAFSKIRSSTKNYIPKKKTVSAFCIALELEFKESELLLRKAGYCFSDSYTFDKIIRFFIEKSVYNIYTINSYLYRFGEELLGTN